MRALSASYSFVDWVVDGWQQAVDYVADSFSATLVSEFDWHALRNRMYIRTYRSKHIGSSSSHQEKNVVTHRQALDKLFDILERMWLLEKECMIERLCCIRTMIWV